MAFTKLNSMKFIGLDGLSHFWSKAKTWIINRITTEVTAKIAEIVANAPEDLDTLKEIADWISAHANDAAAMNTAISTNTSDIATLKTTVAGKSDTGHTHTKSEITDFPTSLPANGGTATKATQDGNGNVITSTYVKKSGDTLTGPIVMKANQYTLETAQLDMKNSDIKGANAIWFDDHAEVGEGLKFPRSSGSNYDFMRLDDGKIKVAPNVTGNANTATESIVAYTSDIPTSLPANGGTATKATQLQTARTINIQDSSATYTGTGASFNGSGDVTIKLPSIIKANEFKIGDGQQSIAYRSKNYNGFKMHEVQTKALYIEGRESDAGDSGGLAITNDSVTVFGAGDTDGVFRVVNEDNAGDGSKTAPSIFNIFKDGQVKMTNRLTAPSATIGDRPVITGTYSASDGILNLYTN